MYEDYNAGPIVCWFVGWFVVWGGL